MKWTLIITLALCLGACASQPEKSVTADRLASQSTDQMQPSSAAKEPSSDRVYLDDYDRVPFQPQSGQRVLQGNKG